MKELDAIKSHQSEASKEFDAFTIIQRRLDKQADEMLLTGADHRMGIPRIEMNARGAEVVVPMIDTRTGIVKDTVRSYTHSTDSDGNVIVY
jgi:hypothetical protein